jgi:hypothetical protein
MPLPDEALLRTLNALRQAGAAVHNVARASSEVDRQHLSEVATDRLNDVGARIDELAKAAADHPPLFGQHVGDGLDVERGQARVAIGLLRKILTDHVILDPPDAERRLGARVGTMTGSRVFSGEELALVVALTSHPDHLTSRSHAEVVADEAAPWRPLAQAWLDEQPLASIVHPVEQVDAMARWLAYRAPRRS